MGALTTKASQGLCFLHLNAELQLCSGSKPRKIVTVDALCLQAGEVVAPLVVIVCEVPSPQVDVTDSEISSRASHLCGIEVLRGQLESVAISIAESCPDLGINIR